MDDGVTAILNYLAPGFRCNSLYVARSPRATRASTPRRRYRPQGRESAPCTPACGVRSARPPQDWPLALCDYRSVTDDEGVPNFLFRIPAFPDPAALPGTLPGDLDAADAESAASVFAYRPGHRWYYFPSMDAAEAARSATAGRRRQLTIKKVLMARPFPARPESTRRSR